VDNFFMTIALLTDFGTSDHYVASMKGVILGIAPDVRLIDITHEIAPQDVRTGHFTLAACYQDFPSGTIFVGVVDPGVGTGRRAILVDTRKYFFVGPDNGLFGFALAGSERVVALTEQQFHRPDVAKTFHGRDIFAPVAGYLATGMEPEKFGPRIADPVELDLPKPAEMPDGSVAGEVLHIDRFGNLITSLTPQAVTGGFEIELGGSRITAASQTYGEAPASEPFIIAGSSGYIEISLKDGSAASALGAGQGQHFVLRQR
jgi:S-adenosylmethionine hydrolase